jgi:predicted nucleotidyltransferase
MGFKDAIENSISAEYEGVKFQLISVKDLIKNKTASGRAKDIADVEQLEKLSRGTKN